MEKFYITTALPYVNAPPHIGFALEAIQADVIARQKRLEGKDVYFLSGTDEHGAKIARAAEKAGVNVKDFVDENAQKFKDLFRALSISNDDFIRTSDQMRHFPGAQRLWRTLVKKGDIYKAVYKGLYCVGHEAFITEKDMADGKCKDHGTEPEELEEENYYFRLSQYTEPIKKIIESGEMRIFPDSRKNEILSLLREGLQDISFSRPSKDISWGVPVPDDPTQTMYVWCDALSNYISALGFGSEDESKLRTYWPADVHVIGKDILRFHAAIWLGMLLSAGLDIPKAIFVHGFINMSGQKMSKTLGNVIDPFEIVGEFGADALRYYMLREVQPFEDNEFSKEKFIEVYNANLAHGLGNYVSRVLKMIETYFGGEITKPEEKIASNVPLHLPESPQFKIKDDAIGKIETFTVPYYYSWIVRPSFDGAVEAFQFSLALDDAWRFISLLDSYIQTYEPFKLIKMDKEKTQAVLWSAAYGACAVAEMLEPFLPETSKNIFEIFGATSESYKKTDTFRVSAREGLFPKK